MPVPIAHDAELLPPRRFTIDEYRRLAEAGILGEDDHVELIEGVIVEMTPQSRAHARIISRLNRLLAGALGADLALRPQLPLSLDRHSEPEPDLAIVSRAEEDAAPEHPRTAELVIEVASESLRRDRVVKGRLYARAGVREYWIVDVARRAVEVHLEPDPGTGTFRRHETFGEGSAVASSVLPGLKIDVAALFA